MLLLSAAAKEKGLDLYWHIDPNCPATISTDILRLQQVLLNLLSNAVKFTQQGEVSVSIAPISSEQVPLVLKPGAHTPLSTPAAVTPSAAAAGWLRFSVRDTGMGISEEECVQLFRAFVQGKKVASTFGGTGLGLAISRRLVEAMGGALVVKSQLQVGSEFSFFLPCALPNINTTSEMVFPDTSSDRRNSKDFTPRAPTPDLSPSLLLEARASRSVFRGLNVDDAAVLRGHTLFLQGMPIGSSSALTSHLIALGLQVENCNTVEQLRQSIRQMQNASSEGRALPRDGLCIAVINNPQYHKLLQTHRHGEASSHLSGSTSLGDLPRRAIELVFRDLAAVPQSPKILLFILQSAINRRETEFYPPVGISHSSSSDSIDSVSGVAPKRALPLGISVSPLSHYRSVIGMNWQPEDKRGQLTTKSNFSLDSKFTFGPFSVVPFPSPFRFEDLVHALADEVRLLQQNRQLDIDSNSSMEGTALPGLTPDPLASSNLTGMSKVPASPGLIAPAAGSHAIGLTPTHSSDAASASASLPTQSPQRSRLRPFPVLGPETSMRVLVAEDNLVNQRLLMMILSRLGFEDVTMVADGTECVKKWQEDKAAGREHDVILMDIGMSPMDGIEACKRIRSIQCQQVIGKDGVTAADIDPIGAETIHQGQGHQFSEFGPPYIVAQTAAVEAECHQRCKEVG